MRCYDSRPPPLHILSKPEEGVTHHSDRPAQPALPEHLCPVRPARENGPVCPPPHSDPESLQKEPEDPQSSVTTRAPLQQHLSTTSPDWIQQERAGEEES